MAELQQLVYISRASFAPSRQGLGVEPEVGRILVQSRLNNPRRGLVGALYYADGHFFQCLEGSSEAIDDLYATLLADPRHHDLKVLSRSIVSRASFTDWAMKYVPGANDVRVLLKKHGHARFDPFRFDPATVRDMVTLLHRGADDSAHAGEGHPATGRSNMGRWIMPAAAIGIVIVAIAAALLLR